MQDTEKLIAIIKENFYSLQIIEDKKNTFTVLRKLAGMFFLKSDNTNKPMTKITQKRTEEKNYESIRVITREKSKKTTHNPSTLVVMTKNKNNAK